MLLVVQDTWIVVAFVKILEDAGESFGFFVGDVNTLSILFEEQVLAFSLKVRRAAENVLVSCEQSLTLANHNSDYSTCELRDTPIAAFSSLDFN